MKLTINKLIKIFAAILFVVFVGPPILSFFDRPSGEKGYHEHRRNVKHSNDPGPNINEPPPKPRDLGDAQVQVEKVWKEFIYGSGYYHVVVSFVRGISDIR